MLDLGFTLVGVNGLSAPKHARADHSSEAKNTAVTMKIRWKQDFVGKIQDTVSGITGQPVPLHVLAVFNSEVDFTFARCKMPNHNQENATPTPVATFHLENGLYVPKLVPEARECAWRSIHADSMTKLKLKSAGDQGDTVCGAIGLRAAVHASVSRLDNNYITAVSSQILNVESAAVAARIHNGRNGDHVRKHVWAGINYVTDFITATSQWILNQEYVDNPQPIGNGVLGAHALPPVVLEQEIGGKKGFVEQRICLTKANAQLRFVVFR